MKNKKPIKRKRRINANTVVLKDSDGQVRIVLDADGRDGGAYINLFAKDGKSIQISSQPSGAMCIHIGGQNIPNIIALGITEDGRGLLQIANQQGKLGTVLGEEPETLTHRLLLFKEGKHYWKTPTGRKSSQTNKT